MFGFGIGLRARLWEMRIIHATVGSPIAAILQSLIGQVAVTRMKLNAVKTRGFSTLGGFAIILDNARDFSDSERHP